MIVTNAQIAADPRYAKMMEKERAREGFYRASGAVRARRSAYAALAWLLLMQAVVLVIDRVVVGIDLMYAVIGGTGGLLFAVWQNLHEAKREFAEHDQRCRELSNELLLLMEKHKFTPFGMVKPEKHVPN